MLSVALVLLLKLGAGFVDGCGVGASATTGGGVWDGVGCTFGCGALGRLGTGVDGAAAVFG
jgi:hypothetical protein